MLSLPLIAALFFVLGYGLQRALISLSSDGRASAVPAAARRRNPAGKRARGPRSRIAATRRASAPRFEHQRAQLVGIELRIHLNSRESVRRCEAALLPQDCDGEQQQELLMLGPSDEGEIRARCSP